MICLLTGLALAACADGPMESGGPKTAEDWLQADQEWMRKRTAKPEAEVPAETPEPPAVEAGRVVPPSKIKAPPMPLLPPPEVEVKGSIPPAAKPVETPPAPEIKPPPAVSVPEAKEPTPEKVPSPPPLIAAPKPVEPPPPAAEVPPNTGLLPKEIEQRPRVPSAPRLPDPAKLKGFRPAAMQALLGVPDLLRWESHAQVYQYRGAKCVLDIIFYESPAGGPFLAAHLSARGTNGQETEVNACLVDLLPAESWPDILLN